MLNEKNSYLAHRHQEINRGWGDFSQWHFFRIAMVALKVLSPSQGLTLFKTKKYRHLKIFSTSTCQNRGVITMQALFLSMQLLKSSLGRAMLMTTYTLEEKDQEHFKERPKLEKQKFFPVVADTSLFISCLVPKTGVAYNLTLSQWLSITVMKIGQRAVTLTHWQRVNYVPGVPFEKEGV